MAFEEGCALGWVGPTSAFQVVISCCSYHRLRTLAEAFFLLKDLYNNRTKCCQVNKEGVCGHIFKNIICSESTDEQKCFQPCTKTLACGHSCKANCFRDCTKELCQEQVESQVVPACNHPVVKVPCHINKPGTYLLKYDSWTNSF